MISDYSYFMMNSKAKRYGYQSHKTLLSPSYIVHVSYARKQLHENKSVKSRTQFKQLCSLHNKELSYNSLLLKSKTMVVKP